MLIMVILNNGKMGDFFNVLLCGFFYAQHM